MGEIAKSCCEVSYILEHLKFEDKTKIPQSVFDFFQKNSDTSYEVNLDSSKSLLEQELRDETKAFLQILYHNYFDKEKKHENADNDDFQLQTIKPLSSDSLIQEKAENQEKLVSYQESKLKRLINKIVSIFQKRS